MTENFKNNLVHELMDTLKKKNIKYQELFYLTGDASPRRYFIIKQNGKKNILMLDKQSQNLKKFIKVTKLLRDFVSVPEIIINQSEEGILILENFENNKFSDVLSPSNKEELYQFATDALIYTHKNLTISDLPFYTKDLFFEETDIFFDWFIENLNEDEIGILKRNFKEIFNKFLDTIFQLPKVFIHRDYHVDNLFGLFERKKHFRCGWIDYQDALVGPCVYDLVSLTQDARVDVDKEIENLTINLYLKNFSFIDKKIFFSSYKIIAIQRHLKVLGIFSRLSKRDNKKNYLHHIPRVLRLLKINLQTEDLRSLRNFLTPLIGSKYV